MRNFLRLTGTLLRWLLYLVAIVVVGITAYVVINLRVADKDVLWGYHAFTVLSDSMQDTFQAGDVVIIRETDPATLAAGDVIAFYSIDPYTQGEIYTHKIRAVTTYQGALAFTTYGTTTGDDDLYPATAENVIGKLVYVVPYIGELTEFTKSSKGYLLLIIIPVLGCLMFEIRHLITLLKPDEAPAPRRRSIPRGTRRYPRRRGARQFPRQNPRRYPRRHTRRGAR